MKKYLAYLVIASVLSLVSFTTATFLEKSVSDEHANWRMAAKGWHYVSQMQLPDREKQAALIQLDLLNISP